MIRSFEFLCESSIGRDLGMIEIYAISCKLIDTASRLQQTCAFAEHCTYGQARMVGLAAVCILRIVRSDLAQQLDAEQGERGYVEALRFSRSRSVRGSDLDSRNAGILTQLWSCKSLFRFKNGTVDSLRILLRGRLVRTFHGQSLVGKQI
jgi:transcriptional regulatory protein LEU3